MGACAAGGQTQCVDGNVSDTCVEGQPSNEPDLCDGVDSDCDGEVDENFLSAGTVVVSEHVQPKAKHPV